MGVVVKEGVDRLTVRGNGDRKEPERLMLSQGESSGKLTNPREHLTSIKDRLLKNNIYV